MADFYYTLRKFFVASHIHNGEEIHGHNFICICEFKTTDYQKTKQAFNKTIAKLDYKILNNLDFFKDKTPSTEHIALFFYQQLSKFNVVKVEVYETENFSGGVNGERTVS